MPRIRPKKAATESSAFSQIPTLVGDLSSALSRFRSGLNGTDKLDQIIVEINSLCDQTPDAALAAIHLSQLESPLKQPLFSAILCRLLARRLKYTADRTRSLLLAILTSNISLTELQVLLNSSDNPLTDDQWDKIKRHPSESRKIMETAGVEDTLWLNIIEQHHERLDGSGYPKNLKGDEICDEALIVALGEFYTAMIDKRAYRSPLKAQEALRELYDKSSPREQRLQANFIKEVGVFPPGTYVKLTNGEIGLVWKRNTDKVMPMVKALFEPSGKPYMGGLTRDCTKPNFKILSATYPPTKPILDLFKLW